MLVPSTTISCQSRISNGSDFPDMVSAAKRGEEPLVGVCRIPILQSALVKQHL